jgi:CheY-like chemotaxis protein
MLLVVVHSPSFAAALAHLLTPRHRVVVASSTSRALQLLEEREIDAVVADLDLDPIDRGGLPLLREVARRCSSTRRVLLTCAADASTRAAVESGEIHCVLSKPTTVAALLDAVAA